MATLKEMVASPIAASEYRAPKQFALSQQFRAAFEDYNSLGGIYTSMKDAMGMQSSETLDLSFDPFDGSHDLREGYYDNYIDANSDEEIAYINQRIDRELLNEEILSTAPLPVAMAMGVLDPVNLLPLSVLGKGKTVAGTAARFAGTTALTETAVEGVLHDAQETRTLTESLINIGAGSILAGTLGAAAKSFSQIDPTFDMNKLVRDADNQLKELADGSVGAARVADRATLEQLGPALPIVTGKLI